MPEATTTVFVIEDDLHAAPLADVYKSIAEAFAALQRLALIPWNEKPNLAPCQSWRTCGRLYEIVEYDTCSQPWEEVSRLPCLEIDANGVRWLHKLTEGNR
jgi:hypothetical protein